MSQEDRIKRLEEELAKAKEKGAGEMTSRWPVFIHSKEKMKFSGKGDVQEWIQHIMPTLQRFPSEPEKVAFILENLERPARLEVRLRVRTDKATSEEIFTVLKEVYGIKDNIFQLQQKFFMRTQEAKESLDDYAYALMEILLTTQEHQKDVFRDKEATLKERFAEGVRDTSLRRELRRLNLENKTLQFWELRDRAKAWLKDAERGAPAKQTFSNEVDVTAVAECAALSEASSSSPSLWKVMEEQKKQLEELTNAVSRLTLNRNTPGRRNPSQGKSSIQCYYCKKPGHLQRNCFKKKNDMKMQTSTPTASPAEENPN